MENVNIVKKFKMAPKKQTDPKLIMATGLFTMCFPDLINLYYPLPRFLLGLTAGVGTVLVIIACWFIFKERRAIKQLRS